jgi:hypothetical protein
VSDDSANCKQVTTEACAQGPIRRSSVFGRKKIAQIFSLKFWTNVQARKQQIKIDPSITDINVDISKYFEAM